MVSPGSKLNLIESSVLMARDLCIIRLAYMTGLWSVRTPKLGTEDGIGESKKSN